MHVLALHEAFSMIDHVICHETCITNLKNFKSYHASSQRLQSETRDRQIQIAQQICKLLEDKENGIVKRQ